MTNELLGIFFLGFVAGAITMQVVNNTCRWMKRRALRTYFEDPRVTDAEAVAALKKYGG